MYNTTSTSTRAHVQLQAEHPRKSEVRTQYGNSIAQRSGIRHRHNDIPYRCLVRGNQWLAVNWRDWLLTGNNKSSDPVSLDLHLESTRSILFSYLTQSTLASPGLSEMILLDFQYLLPQVPVF